MSREAEEEVDTCCSKEDEAADITCCASCGIAAVDNVKLKNCAYGLVKYCSVTCQKNHRSKHKKACRKRLAEIRDDDLFEQPDGSHLGECPICCLPLSNDLSKSSLSACCGNRICQGCDYANQMRELEAGLEHRCTFCREPAPKSEEEYDKIIMKRIKKNDPDAMSYMGKKHYEEGDYETALKYFAKAAELGDAFAHFHLGCMHCNGNGEGVEEDMKKAIYHWEEAAIAGHHMSRHNLGIVEKKNGRYERARKHFIIAANLGDQRSLNLLRQFYEGGRARREDYADALRAYQTAVDATKSTQRKEGEAACKAREAAWSN
jgi:tetratricopeptide (TPR) repeat protein